MRHYCRMYWSVDNGEKCHLHEIRRTSFPYVKSLAVPLTPHSTIHGTKRPKCIHRTSSLFIDMAYSRWNDVMIVHIIIIINIEGLYPSAEELEAQNTKCLRRVELLTFTFWINRMSGIFSVDVHAYHRVARRTSEEREKIEAINKHGTVYNVTHVNLGQFLVLYWVKYASEPLAPSFYHTPYRPSNQPYHFYE